MSSSKKFLIAILVVLTVSLASVSGYIAYKLNEQATSPEEASAEQIGDCNLGGDGSRCITLEGDCSVGTVFKWTRSCASNCCPVGGSGANPGAYDSRADLGSSPGTYCADPAPGQCEQIDFVFNGQERGLCVCEPPAEEVLQCWETGCDNGTDCASGLECQNDRCVNPDCPSDNNCVCNVTVACNETCNPNRLCPEGLTCSADGKCVNNQCPTETDCTCTTAVQCNETCDEVNVCPSDLTCVEGKCRNNECSTEADCICNVIVDCADPCDSNHLCPTGTMCNNDVCVLSDCVGRNDCEENGCKLPETAIVDGNNRIILGFLFFVIGVFLLKYNVFFLRRSLIGGVDRVINVKLNRSRQQFENQVEEEASKNLKRKIGQRD